MKKIVLSTEDEYRDALKEINEYFKTLPEFEDKQWRRITYLLKATCKYEVKHMGYIDTGKGKANYVGGVKNID